MNARSRAHRIALPFVTVLAIVVSALPSYAQCPGDCSAEMLTTPKAIEIYVKKSWKEIAKCAKKGEPACPTPCPLPDGLLKPFLLPQTCIDFLDCELAALAETAYDTTWDEVGFCPTALQTACGKARGKNGGKIVTDTIKRRRTSKMDKIAKDTAKCGIKTDKAGACGGVALCTTAADWVHELTPFFMKKGGFQTLRFTTPIAGEAKATLTLSTDLADWGMVGDESVVVTIDVDGAPIGQLVLFNGHTATDYHVMLGDLAVGDHEIGLRHDKKLTPSKKSGVIVETNAVVTVLPPGHASYDPLRFAPILRGIDTKLNAIGTHPGNAVSDVPLLQYVRAIPGAGKTTYRYVMIWSNEDGGFGIFPDVLLTRFGRTTDIEGYVEVDVLAGGTLDEVRFRPDESGSLSVFAGEFFQGTHPIVRTATANGLVEDDGESALHFITAPFEFDDSGVPREQGMDLYPVSYVAMAKEVVREGKTEPNPNSPTGKVLSDLRNYLFVEYDIDVSVGGDVLAAYAVVGGLTYRSDHFTETTGLLPTLLSDGVGRTAIELPFGTAITDITAWGFVGIGTMSGTLFGLDGFMLDTDFLPDSTTLSFTGPLFASGFGPIWAVAVP